MNLASQLNAQLQILIHKTGDFIREEFERFSFQDVIYKSENNPVSYVDIQAERMLREGCSSLIPGSGFINEESDEVQSTNGYTWIIDPLDGTVNFMHGNPHFSISLALSFEGELIMGYIFDVMAREMFVALKGKGATLNGRKLQVSHHEAVSSSIIVMGFPYEPGVWLEAYLRLLAQLVQTTQGLRRTGSAALDLAYVAAGRVEGFFEFGLNPWDIAAGVLLIEEAGGKVSDFTNGNNFLFGRQLLGSNGRIHNEVLQLIQAHLPLESSQKG